MGLAAAVIGAGALGAGASILASHNTAGAAKDTAAQNNATTLQIYNQNSANLSPYIQTGVQANNRQASFFGGGSPGNALSGYTPTAGGSPQPSVPAGYPVSNALSPSAYAAPANGTSGPGPLQPRKGQTGNGDMPVAHPVSASGGHPLPSSVMVGGRSVQIGNRPPPISGPKTRWIDNSNPNNPVLKVYDSSGKRWAIAGTPEQQQQALGGQTVSGLLSSIQQGQPLPGSTNPDLNGFKDSAGLSGPIDAVANTLGSSEAGYLQNTGQAAPTAAIQAQLGNNFQDYLHNSGADYSLKANDRFLGLGNGGYQGYLENSGVADTNAATRKFLGLDQGGNGFNDFLNSTGYKFNLDTGADAVASNAATQGLLGSGSTLKALEQYGQQLGQTYGQAYLSNLGQFGSQLEGQGLNYSNLLGSNTARHEALSQDYMAGQNGLAGLKAGQAANYLAGNQGLYNLGQNAFANYWGANSDIANRGLSAGNALAGVGTNVSSQIAANNNNALSAVSGANANFANNVSSFANNALGAWSYAKGMNALAPSTSWGGYYAAGAGGPSAMGDLSGLY